MQLVEIKEVADYGRAEKWPPQDRGGGGKAGNRDQGTGSREQGLGNREQGIGNRKSPVVWLVFMNGLCADGRI